MRRLAVLLLFLLLAPPAWPVEAPGARPDINVPFEDAEYEHWVGIFERPGREVYDRRHQIVEATGAWRGAVVADVGAGTGLFTRLFARAVGPEGRVYAVDISRGFVKNILRTARAEGLTNVEGIVNTQTETLLPPNAVDIAFVSDTYHHFEQPRAMLASIRRALRPGGALIVVDFERIEGRSSAWVMEHVRAGKEAVIREVEAEGFRFAGEATFLRENYFLRFVRTD
jgi:predicted methyltransferase